MLANPPPSWEQLFGIASVQDGLFTTAQAATAGYSDQLIAKHLRAGRFARMRRGVYRLTHYPPGEHENLVVVWLWSEQRGVFGHETALALHGLSDVLPSKVHLTLPAAWRRRRLRVPEGVLLHWNDISDADRAWVGVVPVTAVRRTLLDCAQAHTPPDLLAHAVDEALARGLLAEHELGGIGLVLRRRGGAG